MKIFYTLIFLVTYLLVKSQSVEYYLKNASELHNSNPDSSYTLCLLAEKLAIQSNNEVGIALSKLGKVRYLLLKNKLEDASQELEIAANLFHKNNENIGLGKTYIAMSNIAGRIHKNEEEIDYLERANAIFLEANDTLNLLKSLTNLSLKYSYAGMLSKGENALLQLEKYTQGMPEKEFYYLNQNWGIFYREKGDYASALRRFETAKSIAINMKMIDSQSTIYLLIAKTNLKQQKYNDALNAIQQSIKIAVDNQLIMEEFEALLVLNEIYEKQNNIHNAYDTYKRIAAIKDTLFNLEKINKINAFERQIALSEKQNIITQQNLELEQQKTQLLKDKIGIYLLIAILFVVLISVIFLIINIKNKKKANQIIQAQKDEVEQQKQLIENKNFEILSSITYAKRIQEAILPQDKLVKEYLANSFVFYKPKDIVSGDFYWMEHINNQVLFAAVDCTGHGVPGAFMSIVGNNGLNKAVRELKLSKPSQILNALNNYLVKSLHLNNNQVKDGMDISLCKLDLNTGKLEFAGANNPLYILRNNTNEIEIIKGNKQSIGDAVDLFDNHEIQLYNDDLIYIFSDGFADQFGGEKGKKFGYNNLRKLLIKNKTLDMAIQRKELINTFTSWMKNEEQVDDICVIGVRF